MKTIKDFELNNKRVIIRVDFNVPIKDGIITDDNRIKESLDTIKYAIKHGGKVILLSHLGRIKEEADKAKNTLKPVAARLSELLGKTVLFVGDTRGEAVESAINNMKLGDVILLENTRYEDLDGKKESKNDPELGKYWASLGDIIINDAFGTSHRAHASNVGIMEHLPSGIGFLVQKELDNILPIINKPKRPFTVIMGGAKVSDKIGVIDNLLDKCDYILIGGGMAYTFMKAKGLEIGNSLVDMESIDYCKNLLETTDKIILPIDHACVGNIESASFEYRDLISNGEIGLDIGPKTIELFGKYLEKSKTIIWNGPVGYFEKELFAKGTEALCKKIASLKKVTSIVGGGDTASAIINMGFKKNFTHISTGGGASLELLEGKEFPFMKYVK